MKNTKTNTKKKLIRKKTKKHLISYNKDMNKSNDLVKHKTTQRDFRTILAGYVRSENYNSIPEWLEMYKSEFPGPLDKDTLNSLVSHIQNIEFRNKKEMELYLSIVLKDNTPSDYNETTYTSFIKVYSDIRYINVEKVKEYLGFMMLNDIKIKRRTLAPILEMCQTVSDLTFCLSIYNISKIRDLELLDEDYMNILKVIGEKKDIFNTITVMDDMTRVHYIINQQCKLVLDTVFPKNTDICVNSEGNVESEIDIPIKKIPEFSFTTKDITVFSDKIETHVGNIHPKKKKVLLVYKKFLNKNIKNYDTVIDGANVGFFKQGANSGKVLNFRQISLFVDKAISLGRKVFLILHERHIRNISKSDSEILSYIKSKVIHFFSPQGMDDDMYWLYASIYNPKAKIITNDEMRNHIVNISVGDMFTEWKKYRVIKYNIIKDEVMLHMPSKYMIRPVMKGGNMILPFTDVESRISWKYYSY
tara:strand:- start:4275 stop:5696 length:1422 start_codon:yes stop_codon:yes gene_type:complete